MMTKLEKSLEELCLNLIDELDNHAFEDANDYYDTLEQTMAGVKDD